ncbi:unnamed protein product [Fraxinus pennsylvanica]|uniref:Uncharacterized protein n=1 Tax=Fraxinus pennsylvanica TaxID=56036 RepID=A0AAD1YN20_9LAMI|nr:unnamed protein product [Fraxinus pennsylvanica]
MLACSAMVLLKEEESEEETQSPKSSWATWKRGVIICAAALTGGTLMAITGVPVIGASGFASVATAAGSIAGSVAVAASFGGESVDELIFLCLIQSDISLCYFIDQAAEAGLKGRKMTRNIGDVDEFDFKVIGENHNQGVSFKALPKEKKEKKFGYIVMPFDPCFVRPWEGQHDYLERSGLYLLLLRSFPTYFSATTDIINVMNLLLLRNCHGNDEARCHENCTRHTCNSICLANNITYSDFIDSKWAITVDRSDEAGKLLAEVLLKELQGHRYASGKEEIVIILI